MSTATLVHTSCRAQDNADAMARVAAAGRVQADRLALRARIVREHRAAVASATAYVDGLRNAGAVKVGFKICHSEGGKSRFVKPIEDAVWTLAGYRGEDVEAWGLSAQGEHVGEVW